MSESKKTVQSKYSEAGVDIDKGNAFIEKIKDVVADTRQNGVIDNIGGFSAHVAIDLHKYPQPVIVNSTDGVGTKLAVAQMCGRHDTIGIDLVAMCVNDLIVSGARPLSFLDYFAVGKLNIETATEVVKGVAEGCKQAGCALVGGETAEMPGLYQGTDYDLAGFVTGIVNRDDIIDGSDIRAGNKIIGLASNGLHSNGYSLVRKICFSDNDYTVESFIEELGCTLGEELLKPTRIYVQQVLNTLKSHPIHGMVHNTGGGFIDNIPRILSRGYKALVNSNNWPVPPIFNFLEEKGNIPHSEMYRTFNMGIGLLAIVDADKAEEIAHHFEAVGEKAYIIGEITRTEADEDELVTII